MENENLKIWNNYQEVPKQYLKVIGAGKLKGKSDINPQWRLKALTEAFGPCGDGWTVKIVERWQNDDATGQIAVFVAVELLIKGFAYPITGTGGSMLVTMENKTDFDTKEKTKQLVMNDEAYKMAETDAISVCCKKLGIGSAVYEGRWDGSKYKTDESAPPPLPPKPKASFQERLTIARQTVGDEIYLETLGAFGFEDESEIPANKQEEFILAIKKAYRAIGGQGNE